MTCFLELKQSMKGEKNVYSFRKPSGKVFLELINGEWVPNMRYKLMVEFANQLNDAHIFDPQEVEDKYKEFLENN